MDASVDSILRDHFIRGHGTPVMQVVEAEFLSRYIDDLMLVSILQFAYGH